MVRKLQPMLKKSIAERPKIDERTKLASVNEATNGSSSRYKQS